MTTYYEFLEVPATATATDIDKAFLLKIYKIKNEHQLASCEEKEQEVIKKEYGKLEKAYQVLSDEKERIAYNSKPLAIEDVRVNTVTILRVLQNVMVEKIDRFAPHVIALIDEQLANVKSLFSEYEHLKELCWVAFTKRVFALGPDSFRMDNITYNKETTIKISGNEPIAKLIDIHNSIKSDEFFMREKAKTLQEAKSVLQWQEKTLPKIAAEWQKLEAEIFNRIDLLGKEVNDIRQSSWQKEKYQQSNMISTAWNEKNVVFHWHRELAAIYSDVEKVKALCINDMKSYKELYVERMRALQTIADTYSQPGAFLALDKTFARDIYSYVAHELQVIGYPADHLRRTVDCIEMDRKCIKVERIENVVEIVKKLGSTKERVDKLGLELKEIYALTTFIDVKVDAIPAKAACNVAPHAVLMPTSVAGSGAVADEKNVVAPKVGSP